MEVPLTVPCTIRLSPVAIFAMVDVAPPPFTIVAFEASIVYTTLLAFVIVIEVPLMAVTLPATTGSPLPWMGDVLAVEVVDVGPWPNP